MLGHQVTGPVEGRPVHPPGPEPERIELGSEDISHGPDAREVHGATVDVDQLAEQGQATFVAGVHGADDGLLGAVDRTLGRQVTARDGGTGHRGREESDERPGSEPHWYPQWE